ncbi:hypothetical protein ABEB36_004984 [Hypothenemus hampei]|uniref:Zinc finger CCCH domain-containing protein 14 n=1 Tax=Hypothenemus hampei TaxID=57062 RepID=A0ABD1EWL3_HYPHA
MDSIGAEVGQKMRSAIKAKLMELDCYVDDELPDYIMVMVANRRTKSQMNEDLSLFLSNKTSIFVNWLHIVLKKLKQVTVTNPQVYKKALKRKGEAETTDVDVKVEKSQKKVKNEPPSTKSSNKLAENRKIIISSATKIENCYNGDDNFDIPLLSDVNDSVNEESLQEIEKKIRNVKNRLGLLVESDHENEDDPYRVKSESIDTEDNSLSQNRKIRILNEETVGSKESENKKNQHKRITFESSPEHPKSRLDKLDDESKNSFRNPSPERSFGKKRSVLERLGKRLGSSEKPVSRIDKSALRDHRSRSRSPLRKEILPSRLGVQSKVTVIKKPVPQEPEVEEKVVREVQSAIKVKPRVLPPNVVQPNKNLLLKAVAEAQKSVAQTPRVGKEIRHTELFTKGFIEKRKASNNVLKTVNKRQIEFSSSDEYDSEGEYIPKPIRNPARHVPSYVPSSKHRGQSISPEIMKQQIVVTLDSTDSIEPKRGPSPIVFNPPKETTGLSEKLLRSNIPDALPILRCPLPLKNKERCKYWPNCRQGDKCEFVHPSEICQTFPQCKFGSRCLFIHPKCKFGTSCTKRDCLYTHPSTGLKLSAGAAEIQNCKFFPNCNNIKCPFFHPKLCKFGKDCSNIAECTFSHQFITKSKHFSWISK